MFYCKALFYYTLGNIEPRFHSTLKTIQLIVVITYPLLKKYGFAQVLQPFIADVNKLRKVSVILYILCLSHCILKGCVMKINGRDILVKGTVLAVLADTQAAHSIGGFKVGVGFSLRRCRNCLATKEYYCSKVCLCVVKCVFKCMRNRVVRFKLLYIGFLVHCCTYDGQIN